MFFYKQKDYFVEFFTTNHQKTSYNRYIQTFLGVDKMPVTLELILFILIAISAVGYLIKESQKTKKRTLGISLELLVLFWSIWRISTIIIQVLEYNLS